MRWRVLRPQLVGGLAYVVGVGAVGLDAGFLPEAGARGAEVRLMGNATPGGQIPSGDRPITSGDVTVEQR